MAELNTTNITGSLSLNQREIFSLIYPIGSIYMSVNSTNPSLLFGGTWEEFSKGRVLIGVDTSNTSFEESEKTGGASTIDLKHSHTVGAHTHSIPSHTHTTGSHTLTLSEIPAHTHAIYSGYGDIGSPTMSSDAYRYQFWEEVIEVGMTEEDMGLHLKEGANLITMETLELQLLGSLEKVQLLLQAQVILQLKVLSIPIQHVICGKESLKRRRR